MTTDAPGTKSISQWHESAGFITLADLARRGPIEKRTYLILAGQEWEAGPLDFEIETNTLHRNPADSSNGKKLVNFTGRCDVFIIDDSAPDKKR